MDETLKKYWEYMGNTDNICKCDGCPENIHQANNSTQGFCGSHECGQQNCWIDIYTREKQQ